MKTLLSALLVAFCVFTVSAQTSTKGLARVNKKKGIEVYVMAEPLRAYEALEEYRFSKAGTSFITGGLVNEGISDKLSKAVDKAVDRSKKSKKSVDAILYTGGKHATLIHFTEPATPETEGIGRVNKVQGRELYVWSDPLVEYNVVFSILNGLKVKSFATGGLVNNSIEEDLGQYMTNASLQAQKNGMSYDAVIYSLGKSAVAIAFKQDSYTGQ